MIRLTLFICITFVLTSCSNDNSVFSEDSESAIEIKNGALFFDTQIRFEETLNQLINDSSYAEVWRAKYSNYDNMLDATEQAFDDINDNKFNSVKEVIENYGQLIHYELDFEGEGMLVRNVPNDALAILLNKNGIVHIGEHTFKVDQNTIYQVNSKNMDLLTAKNFDSPLVQHYAIEKTDIDQSTSNPNSGKAFGPLEKCTYYYSGNDKRLRGKISATRYCPIACDYILVFETLHQKKNVFNAWVERKTKKLRLSGHAYGLAKDDPSTIISYTFDTGYKKDKKRLIYEASACTSLYSGDIDEFCGYDANITSYCKCDNSVYTDCSVSASN